MLENIHCLVKELGLGDEQSWTAIPSGYVEASAYKPKCSSKLHPGMLGTGPFSEIPVAGCLISWQYLAPDWLMLLFSSLDSTLSGTYILPEEPCIEIRGPWEYVQGQVFL